MINYIYRTLLPICSTKSIILFNLSYQIQCLKRVFIKYINTYSAKYLLYKYLLLNKTLQSYAQMYDQDHLLLRFNLYGSGIFTKEFSHLTKKYRWISTTRIFSFLLLNSLHFMIMESLLTLLYPLHFRQKKIAFKNLCKKTN